MIKLNATIVGALALIAAAPAAAEPAETKSVDVVVGTLDLSNREQARQFDRQLQVAARRVCDQLNPSHSRNLVRTRCEMPALQGARRDADALRVLHEARH